MKAVQYQAYGGFSENRLVDLSRPEIKDGEVLVQMETVGINPLDNTLRSGGHYAATPENLPRIGGQTGVGMIVESKSERFAVGNRVFVRVPGFGVVADGTWREFAPVAEAGVWLVPDNITAHLSQPRAKSFQCRRLPKRFDI